METNMAIIAGVTFGIAFSQVNVGTKTQKKEVLLGSGVILGLCDSKDMKSFLLPPQLIGMLLACCLSRIITANQYEMV